MPTPEDNLPETILAGYGGRPNAVTASVPATLGPKPLQFGLPQCSWGGGAFLKEWEDMVASNAGVSFGAWFPKDSSANLFRFASCLIPVKLFHRP